MPYSIFPVTFFPGCLSSHSEVLWARATCLECSVSCGEWVKRPGDIIFCCSSHFFKFRQVTTRESLTCPHLLCSQTSSDGLEKYIFKKIQGTGHKGFCKAYASSRIRGLTLEILRPFYKALNTERGKRREAIFILVGNTRDIKTIDPFVSISPHFCNPARPNLVSVLTFPEGSAVFYLDWDCFPRNQYVSWHRERFLGEWVSGLGSVVP